MKRNSKTEPVKENLAHSFSGNKPEKNGPESISGRKKTPKDESGQLRQMAEKSLDKLSKKEKSPVDEYSNNLKLLHELQVYKIELEIQNEQLREANSNIEETLRKYSALYDFAPIGYFTIDDEMVIISSNLTAADMLDVSRQRLKGRKLIDFINPEKKAEFSRAIKNTFDSRLKQRLEAGMRLNGRQLDLLIEATVPWNSMECLLAIVDITDRKMAEEALRANEEKYRALIDNSHEIIYTLTPAGIIDFMSPGVEKLTGYPPQAFTGKHFSEIVHQDDVEVCEKAFSRLKTMEEKQFGLEHRLQYSDGSWKWHMSNVAPILDKDGKLIYFLGNSRDINILKTSNRELQGSRQQLKEVIEFSDEAKYKRNLVSDNYEYLSPVIKNITEYDIDEMKKMPLKAIFKKIHPDDGPVVKKAVEESGGIGKKSIHLEYRFLCKDGNYRWISDDTVSVRDENGNPAFLFGTIRDINERKILELKLKKSEESLKIATDSAGVGLWDWAIKENKIELNEQWFNIAGYSPEELSPASIETLDRLEHPDDLKKNDEILAKVFSGELDFFESETRIKNKDGKWHWVRDRGKVVEWDKDNKPARMAGTRTNIDDQKNAEEKILHLSYHDSLTGVYNRAFFDAEVQRLNTKRQLPLSIIICDLNNLKLINDSFGHLEGDSSIKGAAEIIKKVCRSDDIIARWGGDEFIILLPKTTKKDAKEVLERIKKESEKTISQKTLVSISLGASTKENTDQEVNSVIQDAESKMYKNKLNNKEKNSNSIIFAIRRLLSEKSYESLQHIENIRKIALSIGKEAGLPDSQLDELSLLASMHDIGKVTVPGEILMKKGRLSKKEWNILKKHPETGFNIVQASAHIAHIAKPLLSCHENWDGSGYPKGLKGEEIPVISRIMLIAEAYDAMINERSYKKQITGDQVIAELKNDCGKRFDPFLVDKFLGILLHAPQ